MSEKDTLVKAAKEELSEDQLKMFDHEYEQNSKSLLATYLLWFLFGFIGIHKFYVRKTGRGVLYIFTGGLFVIGWLIDIFLIPSQVRQVNETIENEIISKVKTLTIGAPNNKQELLTRLTDITQDIIFAKKQQLKIVYYVLLLFAAIIAVSQQFKTIYPLKTIHPHLKLAIYIIVALVAVFTSVHQVYNKNVIKRYRDHAGIINILLGSKVKNNINKLSKYPDPSPKWQNTVSWLYTGFYILLTTLGAGLVCFIINLK